MILPLSWVMVLETVRPAFCRRGTFAVFCTLATGMVARTSWRSVVSMLSGARMAGTVSFHPACRFCFHTGWDVDRLGPSADRLLVDRLLGADEPIVVVDEMLFQRWGRNVHHAFWAHDGVGAGREQGRPGQPVGGGWDRGAAAIVHGPGVSAVGVSALGGQGHRQLGGAGR
jgi:hypothetical protein